MKTSWSLGEEGLQRFAVGYVDYPKDTEGEPDMPNPQFHKGHVTQTMKDVAQLRYVAEEGEKPCLEHDHQYAGEDGAMYHRRVPRLDCALCRQALKEEAGL